jgi:hypothetical protein
VNGFQTQPPTDENWPDELILDEDDALALTALYATHAHTGGLSIAQKNAAELGERGLTAPSDSAHRSAARGVTQPE